MSKPDWAARLIEDLLESREWRNAEEQALECTQKIRSLLPDPNWLAEHDKEVRETAKQEAQLFGEKISEMGIRKWIERHDKQVAAKARLKEAKFWREHCGHFKCPGDSRVAELEREAKVSGGKEMK
jgi:hypothetical protein